MRLVRRGLGARVCGLAVLAVVVATGAAGAASIDVFGKRLDCPTTLRDGVLFAPVQRLGPALGLTQGEWDPQALRLTFTRNGQPELKVTEGVLGLWVRGVLVAMRARPYLDPDGLLWAPVAEFCAGAGEGGYWSAEEKCFYIRPAVTSATLWPRGDNLELRIRASHPVRYRQETSDPLRPSVVIEDAIAGMGPTAYAVGGWRVRAVEAQQIVKPAFAVRISLPVEQALEFVPLTAPPAEEIVVRVGPPGWARSATGLPKVTSLSVRRVAERELEASVALDKPWAGVKVFPLGNPPRLVVDFEGAVMMASLNQAGEGPVRGVRTSQFRMGPYVTRVVFDLDQQLPYEVQTRAGSARLAVRFADRPKGAKVILLDAGHGGHDPGAKGLAGTLEKTLNLDVALRLGALLEEAGYIVFQTRRDDSFVDLYERANFANRLAADVFLSVHHNASVAPNSAQGTETYYFENAEAGRLAGIILEEMVVALGTRSGGAKQQRFVVVREATMPSVLVEVGYLNNAAEEARMLDPAFRQAAAEAIARGVMRFFAESPGRQPGAQGGMP